MIRIQTICTQMKHIAGASLLIALTLPGAFAYITQSITVGSTVFAEKRADSAGVQFLLNNGVTPGLQFGGRTVLTTNSTPVGAVAAAVNTWNGVSTSAVHFNPVTITTLGHDPTDCKHVISVATSAADISAVGGALAVTLSVYPTTAGSVCGGTTSVNPGTIIDSDIVFSSSFTFSTDGSASTTDFQSVLTHEMGHSLGANHSGLLGSTMFPFTLANQINQRTLSSDDVAFATFLYPAKAGTYGTLSGKISAADGSAIKYGLLSFMDRTAGTIFGGITALDGTYSIPIPPGSYIVAAEPFNSFIGAINIYSTATLTGVLDPTQATTAFEPTFLGSTANPTVVPVTAGQSATANITVTAGASSFASATQPPFYGFGIAGGSGDITNVLSLSGAVPILANQTFDMIFTGGGVDASTSVVVFGRGIALQGTPRVDAKENFGLGSTIRFTLNIPSQTDVTLATIWIVKGGNILASTGGLVILPPKPAINPAGVVALYSTSTTVQPGSWTSIFGSNLAPGVLQWNGDYPTQLGGVSVTVNNKLAYLWFVSSTQINMQTPDDTSLGSQVDVVVTTPGGTSTQKITLAAAGPSFNLLDATHAAGVILTPNGSGAQGGGTYDFLGPVGAFAFATRPAKAGETVLLYGTGFGPTSPVVLAGKVFSGSAVTTNTVKLTIAGTTVPVVVAAYASGAYQLNLTIPAGLGKGDMPVVATVLAASTPTGPVITLQ